MLRLVDLDPTNVDWRQELARTQSHLAGIQSKQGHLEEALGTSAAALTLCNALASESPDDPLTRLACGEAYLVRGDIQAASRRPEAARDSWLRALAAIEPVARLSKHPTRKELWARTLLRLDRLDEARPAGGRAASDRTAPTHVRASLSGQGNVWQR